jgi:hypothetical protein
MKWKVGKSKIHGNGVFASEDVQVQEDLGVSIPLIEEQPESLLYHRNTFGLLVNESEDPNAKVVKLGKDWHFVSIKPIRKDEEILVDYKDYEDKIDLESFTTGKRVSVI